MKRTDLKIEKYCVSLYKDGNSLKQISEILKNENISLNPVTVYNILCRNNINLRNKGGKENFSVEEILNMKYLYFEENKTLQEIADKYNCVVNTVKKNIKDDVRYLNRVKLNYKNIDFIEDFFENIDTELKAYLLGFLIADGNVYKDKMSNSYRIRITVKQSDVYILDLFKNALNTKSAYKYREKVSKNVISKTLSLDMTSEKMFKDLSKYGVVPNKVAKTFLPNINKSLMPHLIRGILDGDGCIQSNRKSISFVGSNQLIHQLHDYLVSNLGLFNVKVSVREYKIKTGEIHTNYSICWTSKKDFSILGKFLYKDAHYYYERKYKNWLKNK